jgi:hypothetical protein
LLIFAQLILLRVCIIAKNSELDEFEKMRLEEEEDRTAQGSTLSMVSLK